MLLKDPNYLEQFEKMMISQFNFGKTSVFFDNPDIMFSHADFDSDILTDDDVNVLHKWAIDLKLTVSTTATKEEMITLFKSIAKIKKNPYMKMSAKQDTFFKRGSWLSLKRKGFLLLKAFEVQFLPKVTKVLSTQKQAFIKDPHTGDCIQGYIDMVLEIEGYDKPIIFDLKTAAKPYTEDKIELTEQLTLYAGMKGNEYGTNLVGYVVLCKNITKDKEGKCLSCGHIKSSQHTTCNNEISGVRCGGKWDEVITINPVIQVLVREKSQQQINELFLDIGNILEGMKREIIYKNTDKCNNWYGGKCPYYNACHNNSKEGLRSK